MNGMKRCVHVAGVDLIIFRIAVSYTDGFFSFHEIWHCSLIVARNKIFAPSLLYIEFTLNSLAEFKDIVNFTFKYLTHAEGTKSKITTSPQVQTSRIPWHWHMPVGIALLI